MRKSIIFLCLSLALLNSCSSDKSEINTLLSEWSKLNPNAIGGPYELKEAKEIIQIKIGEITESRWNKMGCKDCKEAVATITITGTSGQSQNINYKLFSEKGTWSLTAWEIEGKEKGNFMPYVDLKVIESRK